MRRRGIVGDFQRVQRPADVGHRQVGQVIVPEQLLRAESLPVLEVLRFETEALLLRTRIVADTVRQTRAARTEAVA